MRTIVIMLCLTILGGTLNFANAQEKPKDRPTAEEMAAKKTAKLAETLKLSDTQKDQVYDLIITQSKEREKINNTRLTQDERHEAMKELRSSFGNQLKGMLNADQLKLYEDHKTAIKNKRKGHHGTHGSGNCPHGNGSK